MHYPIVIRVVLLTVFVIKGGLSLRDFWTFRTPGVLRLFEKEQTWLEEHIKEFNEFDETKKTLYERFTSWVLFIRLVLFVLAAAVVTWPRLIAE